MFTFLYIDQGIIVKTIVQYSIPEKPIRYVWESKFVLSLKNMLNVVW